MNFNTHLFLKGKHAFLSPSRFHWTGYDEEKLVTSYHKHMASQRGIELHEFAHKAIDLGIKLPKTRNSLNCYVNDAIGFKMITEQILFYSENSFGTADTIAFRKNFLRIHDLKTGATPASIKQLEVYTALFCLEYHFKPNEIDIELRLYQSDEVLVHRPESNIIFEIMDKIVIFDKLIQKIKDHNGMEKSIIGNDLKKLLEVIQGG